MLEQGYHQQSQSKGSLFEGSGRKSNPIPVWVPAIGDFDQGRIDFRQNATNSALGKPPQHQTMKPAQGPGTHEDHTSGGYMNFG
jgi:hypothetical protein